MSGKDQKQKRENTPASKKNGVEARGKGGENKNSDNQNPGVMPDDMTPKWRPELAFTENKYYTAISKKCHKLKMTAIIATIVFILSMMTVFGNEITVENFKYLIKDLDIGAIRNSDIYSRIIYDGATSTEFGMFKSDLAVVGSGSSNLYNMAGSSVFTKTNSFYDPVLLTSDKYFMVYDKGDTSCTYTVYNAFSELKTEKMEYPIASASIASNGSYAIVTRSSDYKGMVYIYNNNFQVICKIQKDKYIMNCQLRSDGKKALVLSAYDNAGAWCSEIMVCDISTGGSDVVETIEGEIALTSGYHSDGSFSVMTDKSIIFYSSSGEQTRKYDLSGNSPINCKFGGKYSILAYNHNVIGTDKAIVIFDNAGNTVYEGTHTGEITSTMLTDDYAYILFDERLERITVSDGAIRSVGIDANCLDFVDTGSGYFLLCYSGVAVPVSFTEDNTNTAETSGADSAS